MPARDDVLAWIDELLDVSAFSDYCVNGLQVQGVEQVTRIAAGVSANAALLEAAAADGADLLLVHHGLFWKPGTMRVDAKLRHRLQVLFAGDVNLAGYHLPLDAHPRVGNNALIADALALERRDVTFAEYSGRALGVVGDLPSPTSLRDFCLTLTKVMGQPPLQLGGGEREICTVAVCSGGAATHLEEAAALGADAFVTGEPKESSLADARELGIEFFAAGHHATEVFGIRELARLVGEHFGIPQAFHDVRNPV